MVSGSTKEFGSVENYNEEAVRKRIKDLSDYLASRQQKEF